MAACLAPRIISPLVAARRPRRPCLACRRAEGRTRRDGTPRRPRPSPAARPPARRRRRSPRAGRRPPVHRHTARGAVATRPARAAPRFCHLVDARRFWQAAGAARRAAASGRGASCAPSPPSVSSRRASTPRRTRARSSCSRASACARARASPLPDGVATLFFTLGRVGTTTGGWLITAVQHEPITRTKGVPMKHHRLAASARCCGRSRRRVARRGGGAGRRARRADPRRPRPPTCRRAAAAVTAAEPAAVLAPWLGAPAASPREEAPWPGARRAAPLASATSSTHVRHAGRRHSTRPVSTADDRGVVTAHAVTTTSWHAASGAASTEASGVDHTLTLRLVEGVVAASRPTPTPTCRSRPILEAAGVPAARSGRRRPAPRAASPGPCRSRGQPAGSQRDAGRPARYPDIIAYDRDACRAYADKYALTYNPTFARFTADCANFARRAAAPATCRRPWRLRTAAGGTTRTAPAARPTTATASAGSTSASRWATGTRGAPTGCRPSATSPAATSSTTTGPATAAGITSPCSRARTRRPEGHRRPHHRPLPRLLEARHRPARATSSRTRARRGSSLT